MHWVDRLEIGCKCRVREARVGAEMGAGEKVGGGIGGGGGGGAGGKEGGRRSVFFCKRFRRGF